MRPAALQVGLEVLGVVENMSGLEQAVSGLRFLAPGCADASSGAPGEPVDVTAAALAALARVAPDLVARSDVFLPTKGGARAMAADMGVPFLGRVPLDPALSLAGAPGCSAFPAMSRGHRWTLAATLCTRDSACRHVSCTHCPFDSRAVTCGEHG